MEKLTIGIIGFGVLGQSFKQWLEEHTSHSIVVSDPPKGINDDLTKADVFFISIHIPTQKDGSQDTSTLEAIIRDLPNKPIFIRTTIKPGTSKFLSETLDKDVNFLPEFLTERTAYDDFKSQPMVFTAHVDLLKNVFKDQHYMTMTSSEAELTKYAHNVFGALKVTYFNGIYDLCQESGCDYEKVREGVLLSKYINPTHTMVPGPDGSLGYGGKCFPKDVQAFDQSTKDSPINKLIACLEELNANFRK